MAEPAVPVLIGTDAASAWHQMLGANAAWQHQTNGLQVEFNGDHVIVRDVGARQAQQLWMLAKRVLAGRARISQPGGLDARMLEIQVQSRQSIGGRDG